MKNKYKKKLLLISTASMFIFQIFLLLSSAEAGFIFKEDFPETHNNLKKRNIDVYFDENAVNNRNGGIQFDNNNLGNKLKEYIDIYEINRYKEITFHDVNQEYEIEAMDKALKPLISLLTKKDFFIVTGNLQDKANDSLQKIKYSIDQYSKKNNFDDYSDSSDD